MNRILHRQRGGTPEKQDADQPEKGTQPKRNGALHLLSKLKRKRRPAGPPSDALSTQPLPLLDIIASHLGPKEILALARANSTLNKNLKTLGRLGAARVAPMVTHIARGDIVLDKTLDRGIKELRIAKDDPGSLEQMIKLAKTLPSQLEPNGSSLNTRGKQIFDTLIRLSRDLAPVRRDRLLLALHRQIYGRMGFLAATSALPSLFGEWRQIVRTELGDQVAFVSTEREEAEAKSRNVPILQISDNSKISVTLPGRTSAFIVDTLHDAKILCELTRQIAAKTDERYGDRVAYLAQSPDKFDECKPAIWPSQDNPGKLSVFVPGAEMSVAADFNEACRVIDPFLERKREVDVRYCGRVAYQDGPIDATQRDRIRTPFIFRSDGQDAQRGAVYVAMPGPTTNHRAASMRDAFELIDSIENLRQLSETRFGQQVEFIGAPSTAVRPRLSVRVAQDGCGLELWLPGADTPAFEERFADTLSMSDRCAQLTACAKGIFLRCRSLMKLGDAIGLVGKPPTSAEKAKSEKPVVAGNPKDPTKFDVWIPGEEPVRGIDAAQVGTLLDPWRGDPVRYGQTVADRFKETVTFHAQQPELLRDVPAIWPGAARGSFHVWIPKVGISTATGQDSAMNFRRAMAVADWARGRDAERLAYQERMSTQYGQTVDFRSAAPARTAAQAAIWPSKSVPGAFGYTLPGAPARTKYLANVGDVQANLRRAMSQVEKACQFSKLVSDAFGQDVIFFADEPVPEQIPRGRGAIWMTQTEAKPRFRYVLPNSDKRYETREGLDSAALNETIESMRKSMST